MTAAALYYKYVCVIVNCFTLNPRFVFLGHVCVCADACRQTEPALCLWGQNSLKMNKKNSQMYLRICT